MKHTEDTIRSIKKSLVEMWVLVEGQVEKAEIALLTNNKEVAQEVLTREKLVDSYELSIDRECENFFALMNPVAVDLRLILSILKINNNLERIGDFAYGIAQFVKLNQSSKIDSKLMTDLNLKTMFDQVIDMLKLCKQALANEDVTLASKVFSKDDIVDSINSDAVKILAAHTKKDIENVEEYFYLHSAIRRIERMGDRCNNIAEDIVFYIDAKVLKHMQ